MNLPIISSQYLNEFIEGEWRALVAAECRTFSEIGVLGVSSFGFEDMPDDMTQLEYSRLIQTLTNIERCTKGLLSIDPEQFETFIGELYSSVVSANPDLYVKDLIGQFQVFIRALRIYKTLIKHYENKELSTQEGRLPLFQYNHRPTVRC
jgi:hypothetical protein